ncbi:hypothetical protein AAZX31_20G182400 [Glycine max]|nr:hypothetical protein GLYMA_20G195400v4 [Glycine max]KAG4908246.1 hypothetical protein JHK86_056730 [Glycine max]KAG4919463.1 hypothetical protein JHK85_057744 [Glycine max]KAG5075539.1 hypothetical protein JHK84_056770 [Glycine max]KAH1036970.1 hypothetical protein GYH30_056399 [Glycine max]|eukprot:XP_014627824.1 probable disease resistance protein RF45 [Glycine max]
MAAAEIAVDNIVSRVVRKVNDVLTQDWALLNKKERRMLKWLRTELSDMQEFIQHLERSDSSQLEYFEGKIKDVALQTERIIDTFIKSVERRRRRELNIFRCFDDKIEKQLKQASITDSIEDISDEIMKYESRPGSLSEYQLDRRGEVWPWQPRIIFGFDGDVETLKDKLLSVSDEDPRCIISIVGIAGTGKTALATLIRNNEDIRDGFKHIVWVAASPSHTVEEMLEEISKAATQIMGSQQDTSLEALASKKNLIVVDGVATPRVFDALTEKIADKSTEDSFLLTTHNANIIPQQDAGTTRSSFVHHLKLLDDEDSWILFKTELKVHRDVQMEPEMTDLGKKIVAKCGGLPSQILDLSKFFSDKDVTKEEWLRLQEQWLRDQGQGQGQNPWSETLNAIVSDFNLPSYESHLKCLSYFKLFPANFGIPARRLVALWVAGDVVPHREEEQEPPEQVAERYLEELIDLNLVQIAKRKPNGKVKTCRLPNALRELLLSEAPENSRILQVADCLDENDIWYNHIHGNTATTSDSVSLREHYKDVLSFLSFDAREGSRPGQEICNFLNLCILSDCLLQLQVLDLEGVFKPKLPENIARLTGLRYLGLRWTYLESLPSSISKLLKLQTLDLKHTYIHTLTSSIWKMELRHLFLSETYRTRFPPKPICAGDSLSDLQTLWGLFVDEETPVKGGLDKLVNIRKLGITWQSMSPQQKATKSQKPTGVDLLVGVLGSLDRILGSNLVDVIAQKRTMESQVDAVVDWIVKLTNLESLRLKSRDEEGRPWNLPLKSLKNHKKLIDMHLLGILSHSSILSEFPTSLVELTLSHSKLEDDPMQILKDLPELRSLSLCAESYVGEKLVCNSQSFPQLYVLKVWKLEQLKEWKIEQKALGSLRQLEIRSCPCMTKLPDGLKHVKTLLDLKLTNMSKEIKTEDHDIPPYCEILVQN